jgi:hypothetical protein
MDGSLAKNIVGLLILFGQHNCKTQLSIVIRTTYGLQSDDLYPAIACPLGKLEEQLRLFWGFHRGIAQEP